MKKKLGYSRFVANNIAALTCIKLSSANKYTS